MAQAMLELEKRFVPVQERFERRQGTFAVIGMDPRLPLIEDVANLVLAIPQHRLPASRERDRVPEYVPVPEAVICAGDRQGKIFLPIGPFGRPRCNRLHLWPSVPTIRRSRASVFCRTQNGPSCRCGGCPTLPTVKGDAAGA